RTLEWSIPSPPPEYNFYEVPVVTARDDWWHRKYEEGPDHRPRPRDVQPQVMGTSPVRAMIAAKSGVTPGAYINPGDHDAAHDGDGGDHDEHHIHMPSPSSWPLVSSLGLAMVCYGLIYKFLPICILGGVWIISTLYAWAMEPATEPEPPAEELSTSTDLTP